MTFFIIKILLELSVMVTTYNCGFQEAISMFNSNSVLPPGIFLEYISFPEDRDRNLAFNNI
jgi:hypothetical protein